MSPSSPCRRPPLHTLQWDDCVSSYLVDFQDDESDASVVVLVCNYLWSKSSSSESHNNNNNQRYYPRKHYVAMVSVEEHKNYSYYYYYSSGNEEDALVVNPQTVLVICGERVVQRWRRMSLIWTKVAMMSQ